MSATDPHEPDYLLPEERPRRPRRRAVALAAAGGLVVAVVGAGAWAATQFLGGGGPQPATVLPPTSTLAYVAIDLDPSLGQKLKARDTLRKLPSLRGKGSGAGDIRKLVFDLATDDCSSASFARVKPWLGDRAALAGVRDGKKIVPVVVVQVTDRDKARAGADDLCGGGRGVAFSGDYMVLAPTAAQARRFTVAEGERSLADDAAYRRFTGHTGEPGVLTAYLAKGGPEAFVDATFGDVDEELSADEELPANEQPDAGELGAPESFPTPGKPLTPAERKQLQDLGMTDKDIRAFEQAKPSELGPSGHEPAAEKDVEGEEDEKSFQDMVASMKKPFATFEGAAASVRFDDGGLDARVVSRGLRGGSAMFLPVPVDLGAGRTTPVVDLPADAAVAASTALAPGWAAKLLEPMFGMMTTPGEGGLSPQDIEALLGDSASLALAKGMRPDAVEDLDGMRGTRGGLRLVGDPAKLETEVRKLAQRQHVDGLVTARGDGVLAVGFDRDYVRLLARSGKLGDSERFRAAVPDAAKAGTVLYADLDAPGVAAFVAKGMELPKADLAALDTIGYAETTDADHFVQGRLRIRAD